jgi:hypothetical protein
MTNEDDRRTRQTLPPSPPAQLPRRPQAPGIRGTALPPEREAARQLVQEAVASVRPVEPERRKLSPPGGTAAPPSSPPASVSPQVDQALGKAVRSFALKLVPPALVALFSAAVAMYVQVKAISDRLETQAAELSRTRDAVAAERKSRLELEDYLRDDAEIDLCRDKQAAEAFEALTPDPDRMEKASKPKPWIDRCPTRRQRVP